MSKVKVKEMPRIRESLLDYENFDKAEDEVSRAFRQHLRVASLWWVSPRMCTLSISAADTLPDWSPSIARPDMTGLLVWAGDTIVVHAPGTDGEFPLVGVMWESLSDRIRITVYTHKRWLAHPYGIEAGPHHLTLVEFGAFDVQADANFSDLAIHLDDTMVGILRLLGTTWLLMQQPTVSDQKRVGTTKRGPATPDQPPKVTDVQIIDLRHLAQDRTESSGEDGGREYHHRWYVRGHWRQQRVGPGRKLLRPVFVSPHIKGPEDAPLKEHRVNVWRR